MDYFIISSLLMQIFLIYLLLTREKQNYLERQKLLDRLMSRDFPEFATYEIEQEKEKKRPQEFPIEQSVTL